MRILLLGKPYLKQGFQELGHQVLSCGRGEGHDLPLPERPAPVTEVLSALPARWTPDFIMLGDESGFPWFLGLEELDLPTVWYAVDAHIHHHWHGDYAGVFDLVGVAQRDYLAGYESDPPRQRVIWLPLFCSPERDRNLGLERHLGACFVGHLRPELNPRRVAFIEQLRGRVPLEVHTGAYTTLYNQARIVVNQAVAGDLNFRCFEAMACGAMLLTDRVGNGLEALFQDRRDLVLYPPDDVEAAAELIRYYLAREAERAAMAHAGWVTVTQNHTMHHRAEQVLAELATAPLNAMVRARLEGRERLAPALARVYERAAKIHLGAAMEMEGTPAGTALMNIVEIYATAMLLEQRRGKECP